MNAKIGGCHMPNVQPAAGCRDEKDDHHRGGDPNGPCRGISASAM